MTGNELAGLLVAALPHLEASRDELRDLDAAIGDGDLGITVADGTAAVVRDLGAAGSPVRPAKVLQIAAAAFSAANPSTLSALVAGGLLAAAKAVGQAEEIDREAAAMVLSAAIERIAFRGKSAPGDKTILDAMTPSLQALLDGPADSAAALASMVSAARVGSSRPPHSPPGVAAPPGSGTAASAILTAARRPTYGCWKRCNQCGQKRTPDLELNSRGRPGRVARRRPDQLGPVGCRG